jgi:hypothetical protein
MNHSYVHTEIHFNGNVASTTINQFSNTNDKLISKTIK